MNILVTGGAGYIGSHTVRQLLQAGHNPVVFDNLSKGHAQSVPDGVPLVAGNLHNIPLLTATMRQYEIEAVVHFAALSLVGESGKNPAAYYNNNVVGTLRLLDAMRLCNIDKIVFSSTAAVYGEPARLPIREESALQPTNVYGQTKLTVERLLADFSRAYGINYVSLRYFNAAGASLDGSIGEDHDPESHLIPLVLKTALGQRDAIEIFGTDYPTPDGTCIRDYVHVIDLADAHVLAIDLTRQGVSRVYNLGSERGFSVKEVVAVARQVTGSVIRVRESARRQGDPAFLVASSSRIKKDLGWKSRYSDLETIIRTAWTWHKSQPHGFNDALENQELQQAQ